MTDRELGGAIGRERAQVRATTGRSRSAGGRAGADVWAVDAARIEPAEHAASSLDATSTSSGRRLPTAFARWAGISRRSAAGTFASLEGSLLQVRSLLGDEWLLAEDELTVRADRSGAGARPAAAER